MNYTKEDIAAALDLAVLKPTATMEDVRCACALANKHGIKSVCVAPVYIWLAASMHDNVSTVIAFPHGNTVPNAKLEEAYLAMTNGARELDVVVNYGRFLDGDHDIVFAELKPIITRARRYGAKVKAILETCYYTPAQLVDACNRCIEAGVDFLKTSTGFGREGADPKRVNLMLNAAEGTDVEVKASGGIRAYADAERYLDMGCTRLGSSHFLELLP